MYLYVELWKPRQKWLEMSEKAREEYVAGIGPDIERLTNQGVEILGFAVNDEETPHRAEYRYLAAWKMPDKSLVEDLEAAVEAAGFHDYFEQVNARGGLMSPEEAMGDMIRYSE